MNAKDVKTLEDLFDWFAQWSCEGDYMRVYEITSSESDEEKKFEVYDCTHYLVAQFSTKSGVEFFK